jgi:hypothetical protein
MSTATATKKPTSSIWGGSMVTAGSVQAQIFERFGEGAARDYIPSGQTEGIRLSEEKRHYIL